MNFRAVATEIMLHANEEKWYETRERIEAALQHAWNDGVSAPWSESSAPGAVEHPPYPLPDFRFWRDQPDGVR